MERLHPYIAGIERRLKYTSCNMTEREKTYILVSVKVSFAQWTGAQIKHNGYPISGASNCIDSKNNVSPKTAFALAYQKLAHERLLTTSFIHYAEPLFKLFAGAHNHENRAAFCLDWTSEAEEFVEKQFTDDEPTRLNAAPFDLAKVQQGKEQLQPFSAMTLNHIRVEYDKFLKDFSYLAPEIQRCIESYDPTCELVVLVSSESRTPLSLSKLPRCHVIKCLRGRAEFSCATCACTFDSKTLGACNGCDEVQYCSKECQLAQWPEHSRVCARKDRIPKYTP